jgi:hypothetical protein
VERQKFAMMFSPSQHKMSGGEAYIFIIHSLLARREADDEEEHPIVLDSENPRKGQGKSLGENRDSAATEA